MNALAVSQSLIDQPGTVAFLVIFGMGVILFFVFRSMAKHLRKIQMAARAEAEAEAKAAGKAQAGASGADAEGSAGGFGATGVTNGVGADGPSTGR